MILLGLGSNIGDGVANIKRAIYLLKAEGVDIAGISSFYQTAAWGMEEQADFVNSVISVHFSGRPEALLRICLKVEGSMGRVRGRKWGPREIDIDLIEFNSMKLATDFLVLPHPYYTLRDFVLVPLAELVPGWVPTGEVRTVETLINMLPARRISKLPDGGTTE